MTIADTRRDFIGGKITKAEFIKSMYHAHHDKLFDYAGHLKETNIASIEITDDGVIMTSRDKGIRMICPPGDHRVAPVEILNFLDYETKDAAMMMRLLMPGDCVIDIGANMGWYAINIARTFPSCLIHAFEPVPQTYAFLEKNIKLNGLSNITAHHLGLSNQRQDLNFYYCPEGSGNASSVNLSERQDAQEITCHLERLDDLVKAQQWRVNFIKCDIEGAELFAFQGGEETLRRDKPVVFTEMLRKWAAKFNYHPNHIISFFSKLGYRCFYAEGPVLKEILEMTDETAETNFFFLHPDQHGGRIKSLIHDHKVPANNCECPG